MNKRFSRFAELVSNWTGRPAAFVTAFAVIVIWGISGPLYHYSDTWQLVINTGTTIITFLMVFVIQNSQNRDIIAIHSKLNEVLRSLETARNDFIGIEHLTDEEIESARKSVEDEVAALADAQPEAAEIRALGDPAATP